MNLKLFVLCFTLSSMSFVGLHSRDRSELIDLGASIMFSDLRKDTFSGTVTSRNVFKKSGTGFDVFLFHDFELGSTSMLDLSLAPMIGYNQVSFDRRTYTDANGVGIKTQDIDASTVYGGLKLVAFNNSLPFGFYLRMEGGQSFLRDIDVDVNNNGALLGTERMLDGGQDQYYAGGIGLVSIRSFHGWLVSFGYQKRYYGKLEARSNSLLLVENLTLETNSFDVSFIYKF